MRWLPWLMMCACAPGDLPEDLSEPTAWLFGHFDERDDDVAAQASALADFASLREPTDPPDRRSYVPDPLLEEHTDNIDQPALKAGAAHIALTSRSDFEVREHRRILSQPTLTCLHGEAIADWTRVFEDGGACFADGLCDDALVRDTIELSDGRSVEVRRQFREILLDDGRDAMVARAWVDGPEQWYSLDVWITATDDRRKTWQVQADWLDLADADWSLARQESHRLAVDAALEADRDCP